MSRQPKPEGTRVADLRQRIPGSLMPTGVAKLRAAALAAGVSPSRWVENVVLEALIDGGPMFIDPTPEPDGACKCGAVGMLWAVRQVRWSGLSQRNVAEIVAVRCKVCAVAFAVG